MNSGFGEIIGSQEALREVYRSAPDGVRAKVVDHLDSLACEFIARSPFVLLSTAYAGGRCDVSPRGGPAGFVKVLDERRVVVPDLNGNNLLDSIENILANGHAGLLFLVPGTDETLRVNGRAVLSVEPSLLDLFEGELRRPKAVIGVEIEQAYVHCAKSFRRGGVWNPQSWPSAGEVPSAAAMLSVHTASGRTPEEIQQYLDASYASGLAQDLPEEPSSA
ncbi:MAG: MSMEG_1061 family FMN-dependent PPOX-type flavoprotein [Acidimicrobiales bacterium]